MNDHTDTPTSPFKEQVQLWRTRLGAGLVLGIGTAATLRWFEVYRPDLLQKALPMITGVWSGELRLLLGKHQDALTRAFPILMGFLCGVYRGITLAWLGRWLHERVLAPLDTRLLQRLPEVRPYDPLQGGGLRLEDETSALPWLEPSEPGSRRQAWELLCHFTRGAYCDDRFAAFFRSTDPRFQPFQWTLLTGRSGSGKTRMAAELLHHELARTHELRGPGWRTRCRRFRVETGEWMRRIIPGLKRRNDDPWDIGWLRPATNDPASGHAGRQRLLSYQSLLCKWKPRRPTAILLDDPLKGDALDVIRTLLNHCGGYHFPVRLLIVNQTIPDELNVAHRDGHWISATGGFFTELATLGDNAAFTREEICRLASLMRLSGQSWTTGDPEMEQTLDRLMGITQGNPLLVELALRSIERGVAVGQLNTPGMLEDRAGRIVKALMLAYPTTINAAECRAIASATLAGPTGTAVLLRGGRELHAALPNDLKDHWEALQRCHNIAIADGLPVIRPEMVGDAFVAMMLRQYCYDEKMEDEIAAFAWRLNARGMVRSLSRAAARSDSLGRILRNPPPTDIAVEAEDVAAAYVHAAIRVDSLAPPVEDEGQAAALTACGWIATLKPRAVEQIAKMITAVIIGVGIQSEFRGPATSLCFLTAAGRTLEDNPLPHDASWMLQLLNASARAVGHLALKHGWHSLGQVQAALRVAQALAQRLDEAKRPLSDDCDALHFTLWYVIGRWKGTTGQVDDAWQAARSADAIYSQHSPSPRDACRVLVLWDRIPRADGVDIQSVDRIVQRVEQLAAPFSEDRGVQALRATFWEGVCQAGHHAAAIDVCELAITKVEAIVDAFPHIWQVRKAQIETWLFLCEASLHHGGPEKARTMAVHLDAIVRQLSSQLPLEKRKKVARYRAIAWQWVSGTAPDRATRLEAARTLKRIYQSFAPDGVLATMHAVGLQCLFVTVQYRSLKRTLPLARYLDALGERFPKNENVAVCACLVWARIPEHGVTLEQWRAVAEEANKLAAKYKHRFPNNDSIRDDSDLASCRLIATIARLCAEHGDVEACRGQVRKMLHILEGRGGGDDFWTQLLECRHSIVHAYLHLEDIDGSEAAMSELRAFADQMPNTHTCLANRLNIWIDLLRDAGYFRRLSIAEGAAAEIRKLTAHDPSLIREPHQLDAELLLSLSRARGEDVTPAVCAHEQFGSSLQQDVWTERPQEEITTPAERLSANLHSADEENSVGQ